MLLWLLGGCSFFDTTAAAAVVVVVDEDDDDDDEDDETDWIEASLPPPPPLSPAGAEAMMTRLPTLTTSLPVACAELLLVAMVVTTGALAVLYRTALLELVGNVNDDCDIAEVEGIAMVAPTEPKVTEFAGMAVTVFWMGAFAGAANVRFLLTVCCEDDDITLYSFGEITTALPLTVLLVVDVGRMSLCFGTVISFCPGESLRTTGMVKLCPLMTAVAVVPAVATIPECPVTAPNESCPRLAEPEEARSLLTIVFMVVTPAGRAVRAPVAVFTT